jgi:acyl-CoA hydrolase
MGVSGKSADVSIDRVTIDIASVVRPGDGVLWGQACAEPQTLVEALVEQRAAYSGASAFLGINYSGIVKPAHADHLRLHSYCGAGHNRALTDAGVVEIHPHPYSRFASLIRARAIRADVVFVQVSPPNARGEHSLGLAAEYLVPALAQCRAIVAEVNDQVPWVYSDKLLKADDFSLSVASSRAPVPLPYGAPGELELKVAANAAPYIEDGATLEFGLGTLPDAVLHAVKDRKALGVHTGAIGDAVAELMRLGTIDNSRKSFDAGRTTCGVLFGSRKLFDFVHENPSIRLAST